MSLDPITEARELIAKYAAQEGRLGITCSFQLEDMVVLHLIREQVPDVPVLFLETGYHFAETVAYRDEMARKWNLNLQLMQAEKSVAEQEAEFGKLYASDPGKCCHLRKVEPLQRGLETLDFWFTGLRREQSPTRANLQVEELHKLPSGRTIHKLSPLATWVWADVLAYAAIHEIPALSLYEQGYLSIGCEPCTAKPEPGTDARSGRWGGKKLECGIHTFTQLEPATKE